MIKLVSLYILQFQEPTKDDFKWGLTAFHCSWPLGMEQICQESDLSTKIFLKYLTVWEPLIYYHRVTHLILSKMVWEFAFIHTFIHAFIFWVCLWGCFWKRLVFELVDCVKMIHPHQCGWASVIQSQGWLEQDRGGRVNLLSLLAGTSIFTYPWTLAFLVFPLGLGPTPSTPLVQT